MAKIIKEEEDRPVHLHKAHNLLILTQVLHNKVNNLRADNIDIEENNIEIVKNTIRIEDNNKNKKNSIIYRG